jgi:hypothetical protein
VGCGAGVKRKNISTEITENAEAKKKISDVKRRRLIFDS